MNFIDLKAQQQQILPQLRSRIDAVLEHGMYSGGPEVAELEQRLARYVGVKHAITVGSGTDALLVAMMALDMQPGDEIITTPFTFIATASMMKLIGVKPVFVDIRPDTYNIDATKIAAAITDKTKAIMPVNLYGHCADYHEINAIAKQHNLAVIEDAAQSFGATYFDKRSCGLGTIGCASFFPAKPLGCYGEGGACFTDDDELATIINQIRNHGQDRRYHHVRLGLNARIATIQAAVLLAKLDIFPEEVRLRHSIAQQYHELLTPEITAPVVLEGNTSVFAQYTIQVDNRDEVQQRLQQQGIPTAVHYPVPVHQQPVFADIKDSCGDLTVSETCAVRVLSLPFHPYLELQQQRQIADSLKVIIKEQGEVRV